MNTKTLILTLMLSILLIGLATLHRVQPVAAATDAADADQAATEITDEAVEFTVKFEFRFRLPLPVKEAL